MSLGVGSILPHPLAGDFPTGLCAWDRRRSRDIGLQYTQAVPGPGPNVTWASQAACSYTRDSNFKGTAQNLK